MSKALGVAVLFAITLAFAAYAQQEKSQEAGTAGMDMTAGKPAAPAENPPQALWPTWQGWSGSGYQGQYPGTGGMGCGMMSGMGMGGMGMGGMGMPGMGMSGVGMGGPGLPGAGPQGMGMYMGSGTTIQDLVQLVTLQDILESLRRLAEIQEKTLGSSNAGQRQNLSRELAEIRKKIEELIRENRVQITGSNLQQ